MKTADFAFYIYFFCLCFFGCFVYASIRKYKIEKEEHFFVGKNNAYVAVMVGVILLFVIQYIIPFQYPMGDPLNSSHRMMNYNIELTQRERKSAITIDYTSSWYSIEDQVSIQRLYEEVSRLKMTSDIDYFGEIRDSDGSSADEYIDVRFPFYRNGQWDALTLTLTPEHVAVCSSDQSSTTMSVINYDPTFYTWLKQLTVDYPKEDL